jgi:hypothetical protein
MKLSCSPASLFIILLAMPIAAFEHHTFPDIETTGTGIPDTPPDIPRKTTKAASPHLSYPCSHSQPLPRFVCFSSCVSTHDKSGAPTLESIIWSSTGDEAYKSAYKPTCIEGVMNPLHSDMLRGVQFRMLVSLQQNSNTFAPVTYDA